MTTGRIMTYFISWQNLYKVPLKSYKIVHVSKTLHKLKQSVRMFYCNLLVNIYRQSNFHIFIIYNTLESLPIKDAIMPPRSPIFNISGARHLYRLFLPATFVMGQCVQKAPLPPTFNMKELFSLFNLDQTHALIVLSLSLSYPLLPCPFSYYDITSHNSFLLVTCKLYYQSIYSGFYTMWTAKYQINTRVPTSVPVSHLKSLV